MRFEFKTTPGCTHIKAILEEGEDGVGRREEGPGTLLKLKNPNAVFDYEVKDMHPDVLGLMCMVMFYPFIGKSVRFPLDVSPRLEAAFKIPVFANKKAIEFRNVSSNVPLYQGSQNMALSFGGGIDSTAVRRIFPNAFVVHEESTRDNKTIPCNTAKVVRSLGPKQGKVITTNQRYLSVPGGWHSWPCAVCTSLLLATDMKFGIILTGQNFGSTFFRNGSGFYDLFGARKFHGPSGNYWQSAFEAIGLPMFSPVSGVSEIGGMKLSLPFFEKDEVDFCHLNKGRACFKCTKCFRRDVIRSYLSEDYQPDWRTYHTSKHIHEFLRKRPLYFGHIFSTALSLKPNRYPKWIHNLMGTGKKIPAIKRDWASRVYAKVFDLCPDAWSSTIKNRTLELLPTMDEQDIIEVETWSQV